MTEPLIFDIGRASFADGPGIRTVVFLKGCPLRCVWCQNPESQDLEMETLFFPARCIKCGHCAAGCNSLARRQVGVYYSPQKLAQLILRDTTFYRASSGGVTFSGGEPLLFIDYLYEVAELLEPEHIHIAVETCGYFDFEKLAGTLLPRIDLFLYDIKLMDPVLHERFTGKSNRLITRNFIRLLEAGAVVEARVPLIPGFTATEENLTQIARFLRAHRVERCSFTGYNPSGLDKWARLGKKPPAHVTAVPMTLEEEQQWSDVFNFAPGVQKPFGEKPLVAAGIKIGG